jgi:hypothetical protein
MRLRARRTVVAGDRGRFDHAVPRESFGDSHEARLLVTRPPSVSVAVASTSQSFQ